MPVSKRFRREAAREVRRLRAERMVEAGELRLSPIEKKAMELFHLGGVGAWRTGRNNIKPNTVRSLMKKGLFTSHGITSKGRQYIKDHIAR